MRHRAVSGRNDHTGPCLSTDTVVKEYGRRGKPCYQAFLNIKGADDSVDRSVLWPKCEKMSWDGELIRFLKSSLDHVKVMVRVEGRRSREVDMGVGAVQGSILSTILFNVY